MTDKTEEQIARERAAIDAMKNAKSNMTVALDRIATLESALRNASGTIGTLSRYIGPDCYTYPNGSDRRTCKSVADDAIASIAKVIG